MKPPCCMSFKKATKVVAAFYLLISIVALGFVIFGFVNTLKTYQEIDSYIDQLVRNKSINHSYDKNEAETMDIIATPSTTGIETTETITSEELPDDDEIRTTVNPEFLTMGSEMDSNLNRTNKAACKSYGPSWEMYFFKINDNLIPQFMTMIIMLLVKIVLAIQLWKGAKEENYWRCNAWFQTEMICFIVSLILAAVIISIKIPTLMGVWVFAISVAISLICNGYPLWIVKKFMADLNHDSKMSYSP